MDASLTARVPVLQRLRSLAGPSWQLIANAGAMMAAALVNAVLGFVFWWIAARWFTPQSVGFASAAISLMGFVALIGEFGFGTLLVGEVQRHATNASRLVSAAVVSATGVAAAAAITAIALLKSFSIDLGDVLSGPGREAIFVIGCAAMCFSYVLDQGMIGRLMSTRQLFRNIVFAVLRVVLLVALAALASAGEREQAIFSIWVIAQIASLLAVAWFALARRETVLHRPDFDLIRPLVRKGLSHHVLNIVTQAPGLILPLLVTILLSATVNAAFFAGWMLLTVATLGPAALTTVLFTVGRRDPAAVTERIRTTLRLSVLASLAAAIGFYLLSDFILAQFNPVYAPIMGPCLQLMGFSVLATMVKFHFIAIERLQDRMLHASWLLGAGGLLEIALAVAGAHANGLFGLAVGWMIAVYIEAAIMLPPVLAVARGDVVPGSRRMALAETKPD